MSDIKGVSILAMQAILSSEHILSFINEAELDTNETLTRYQAVAIESINDSILIDTAFIRANYKIKTPDAIHIATAKLSQCDFILTNDEGMQKFDGIEVILMSDYI